MRRINDVVTTNQTYELFRQFMLVQLLEANIACHGVWRVLEIHDYKTVYTTTINIKTILIN